MRIFTQSNPNRWQRYGYGVVLDILSHPTPGTGLERSYRSRAHASYTHRNLESRFAHATMCIHVYKLFILPPPRPILLRGGRHRRPVRGVASWRLYPRPGSCGGQDSFCGERSGLVPFCLSLTGRFERCWGRDRQKSRMERGVNI